MTSDAGQALGEVVARGTRSSIHAYGAGTVIKVPHSSTPSSWIVAEADYAAAVREVGAPVPRLLGIEPIDGRPASVWERIEGTSMWEHVVEQPNTAGECGRALAEIQLGLFRLVPPLALPAQRDRLVSKVRASAAALDRSLDEALELMPPPGRPPHLCHGDLHPSNVILSDGGPVIVDWFDAARGDPLADVARTLLTLRGDGTAGPRHLPGADSRTLATLTQAYLAGLKDTLALDDNLLERWQAVQAVARMSEGVQLEVLFEVWNAFAAGSVQTAAVT